MKVEWDEQSEELIVTTKYGTFRIDAIAALGILAWVKSSKVKVFVSQCLDVPQVVYQRRIVRIICNLPFKTCLELCQPDVYFFAYVHIAPIS